MSKRLIVIPRWSGDARSDWYPWLKQTLEADMPAAFGEICLADMPNTNLPTVAAWVAQVGALLGRDPALLAETVVIGHSVGCQAVIRSLATLPPGVQVHGVLGVAGWFDVDNPWPAIEPWTQPIQNMERARAAAGRVVTILSDNDPFTSDWEANRHLWQERMNATVHVIPEGQHFNGPAYPVIIQALKDDILSPQ